MVTNNKKPIVGSLLDRLIDDAPEQSHESVKSRGQFLASLYSSVRRDLENLLNTRQYFLNHPKEYTELTKSLIDYGIPDFMSGRLDVEILQSNFCEKLTTIIRRYEPRFKEVVVKLVSNPKEKDRTLRMRIEGLLYAEPMPESIVFDSVLEPETLSFSIVNTDY